MIIDAGMPLKLILYVYIKVLDSQDLERSIPGDPRLVPGRSIPRSPSNDVRGRAIWVSFESSGKILINSREKQVVSLRWTSQ